MARTFSHHHQILASLALSTAVIAFIFLVVDSATSLSLLSLRGVENVDGRQLQVATIVIDPKTIEVATRLPDFIAQAKKAIAEKDATAKVKTARANGRSIPQVKALNRVAKRKPMALDGDASRKALRRKQFQEGKIHSRIQVVRAGRAQRVASEEGTWTRAAVAIAQAEESKGHTGVRASIGLTSFSLAEKRNPDYPIPTSLSVFRLVL